MLSHQNFAATGAVKALMQQLIFASATAQEPEQPQRERKMLATFLEVIEGELADHAVRPTSDRVRCQLMQGFWRALSARRPCGAAHSLRFVYHGK